MKIIDCITYYDEPLLCEVRFNTLDKFIDKFLIIEARFSHSGKKKPLKFKTENYAKFKKKIIYHIIDNEPDDIIRGKILSSADKRQNSIKRINQSYNEAIKILKNFDKKDFFILSDLDEIPNLKDLDFMRINEKIIIFKQIMFYYKFNLRYEKFYWFGSKACKIGDLISPQWLRYIKAKQYPFWRLDTLFSSVKYSSVKIIENGGWHFSNLKTPKKILEKFKNFGHHNEYDDHKINIKHVHHMLKNRLVTYDHSVDQKNVNKVFGANYLLSKENISLLPQYIEKNRKLSRFKRFIA